MGKGTGLPSGVAMMGKFLSVLLGASPFFHYFCNGQIDITTMTIDDYRKQILLALLQASDDEGNARLTEPQAKQLAMEFSDAELADGMDFNTPTEVAEMLLEAANDLLD